MGEIMPSCVICHNPETMSEYVKAPDGIGVVRAFTCLAHTQYTGPKVV